MKQLETSHEADLVTVKPVELGWKQKIFAASYYHSPLPNLVRPFRERYQLDVTLRDTSRRFSIRKRSEPSARILYYHRVNDDDDPFFPAISTSLFEEEMRFLRKHYSVVNLGELLSRLAGGLTEPVIAITFDDGYQDNYHNAFPILRRHGLPATVFLTTGSIDEGESLWFEQLAYALKSARQDFIDLEIDSPSRFWLRSQTERLKSNARIFNALRTLPNTERLHWLATIFQKLSTRKVGALKDRMLTWDQMRYMQEFDMDFGGHSVTHPFLSRMTSEQVSWEVAECKRRIEDELQRPVSYFAYPYGREEDFGAWNKELIRRAGYRAAASTIWGVNYGSTDLMELRRGGPWETSAAVFAYKLDWYQSVND